MVKGEIIKLMKKVYEQGYEKGHFDTVEGGDFCPEESFNDWIDEDDIL